MHEAATMRFRFVQAIAALVVVFAPPAHADHFFTNCSYSARTTATDNSAPPPFGLSNGSGGISGGPGGISCSGFGGSATSDGTRTYGSLDAQGDPADAVFTQSGRATAGGSVFPGRISLSASGSATSSPGLAPVGSPYALLNRETATGQGSATGDWTDFFTIVGAPGTSATLAFTASFSGTLTARSTGVFYDLAVYPCSHEPIACDPITGFGPLGDISFSAPGAPQTISIQGFTQDTFAVFGRASVDAGACAGGACVGAGAGLSGPYTFIETDSASADFTHTAALSVTVLTPFTSFTTASGFDYAPAASTPVPEPNSFVNLVMGLAGLAIATLRKRWLMPVARSLISGERLGSTPLMASARLALLQSLVPG